MVLGLFLGLAPVKMLPAGEMPEMIPLFALFDRDGNQVALEKLRGSVVMINFWATWCAPCIEEMPTMQALKESLSDEPFEILAINMGEDPATVQSFLERTGFHFTFPILLDPTVEVAALYEVQGLPATLLADKSGKYVFGGVGARDWNGQEARNLILPLLAQ